MIMSVVSGKSSDGDDSNSNFSDTSSSWSSVLEISDYDVEFESSEGVAITPPSSGPVKVKSRPAARPSEKRTVGGSTYRHSVQAMRHRSVSPGRPTRVSLPTTTGAAAAPRTSSVGRRERINVRSASPIRVEKRTVRGTTSRHSVGRTNVRSVSPIRAGVPLKSVRVQQRPTSPLKTRRVSPRRTNSGDHPLRSKFFIAVPPISNSLPEETTPSRISDGTNKNESLRYKHRTPPPPKPPKRTLDGAVPTLTPKITAKGPKTSNRSPNPTRLAPIKGINRKEVFPSSMNGQKMAEGKISPVPPESPRRKSEDGALLQVPNKLALPRRRSMPLELLSSKQLLMVETASSEEEEEMKVEETPKHRRSWSLDRENARIQDVKQKKKPTRVSPNRTRRSAESDSLSPTMRAIGTPIQYQPAMTTSMSIPHGPFNPRRKDHHTSGSVTMLGLEVPVVGPEASIQVKQQVSKQQIPAKQPEQSKWPPAFCFISCQWIRKIVHQLSMST